MQVGIIDVYTFLNDYTQHVRAKSPFQSRQCAFLAKGNQVTRLVILITLLTANISAITLPFIMKLLLAK